MTVFNNLGDTDEDGDYDALYTSGGRGISLWSAAGSLIADSGDDLAVIAADVLPEIFNSGVRTGNTLDSQFDKRSKDMVRFRASVIYPPSENS